MVWFSPSTNRQAAHLPLLKTETLMTTYTQRCHFILKLYISTLNVAWTVWAPPRTNTLPWWRGLGALMILEAVLLGAVIP